MKNILSIFSTCCVMLSLTLVSSCSNIYDKHISWQRVKPDNFPVLTATGYAPISLQKSEHHTQKMLMAISASKIAAYAELAEQVYGQEIQKNVSLGNLIIENQQLQSSVKGIVRGAKVVKTYAIGDTYATELSLDFKDVYDIYLSTTVNKDIKKVQYF